MYIICCPSGYVLPITLISTIPSFIFTLNVEFDGIAVFPIKMFSTIGLILGPRTGSSYRYNTIAARSRHRYIIVKLV